MEDRKVPKPTPTLKEKRDAQVIGTNNSSIVSKRSVERLYSSPDEPEFFRHFVKKPQRRSPLINRGYWVRMKAVEHVVQSFVDSALPDPAKRKVVVNLGCGYDPLPFQFLSKKESPASDVLYVDIDYPDLISIKASIVSETHELNYLLSDKQHHDPPVGHVHYQSREYIALGCDLRELDVFERLLKDHGLLDCALLFTAEVSLTYMNCKSVDGLVSWAATLPDARFSILEQLLPAGPLHPFARTMLKHFNSLQTPLKSVETYPTLHDQVSRYSSRGWKAVDACDLLAFWSTLIPETVKQRAEKVEAFDEWEEFYLFAQHYFILYASNGSTSSFQSRDLKWKDGVHFHYPTRPGHSRSPSSEDALVKNGFKATYTHTATMKRRFGAAAACSETEIVYQGGLSATTRIATSVMLTTSDSMTSLPKAQDGPGPRMCHTVTALPSNKLLLVGGRTSPESPLKDTYLFESGRWKRAQDLPSGRYRHAAMAITSGSVLIHGGRGENGTTLDEWLLWSEDKGWQTVTVQEGSPPLHRFAGTLLWTERNWGLLTGGLDQNGDTLSDMWRVDVNESAEGGPVISVSWSMVNLLAGKYLWRRFGAQTVNFKNGEILLVGGVSGGGCFAIEDSILAINVHKLSVRAISVAYPNERFPLLVGHSAVSFGDRVVVCGGGGVCFSFGACSNDGVWTMSLEDDEELTWNIIEEGKEIESVKPLKLIPESLNEVANNASVSMGDISKMEVTTREDFETIVSNSKPVLMTGLDIGACTQSWKPEYLKDSVGPDTNIVVHRAQSENMSFQRKNFTYETMPFGTFIDSAFHDPESKLYLRAISTTSPSSSPTKLAQDYPGLAKDFVLPPQLSQVIKHEHSSPLRISSANVGMWLHFDTLANVLCHISGRKLFRLYPPQDVNLLSFPHGASSSTILDVFSTPSPPGTSPMEIEMNPGDVLYIPPMWLHAAKPLTPCVAVNVFWMSMPREKYPPGKDVYGNKDLQAYGNGRKAVEKIKKEFGDVEKDVAGFYLRRLAKELLEAADEVNGTK